MEEEKWCCLFEKECPYKELNNCMKCPEYKEAKEKGEIEE